jgi:hypothetical protein
MMAKKARFVGRIQHTETTIQRLYRTNYYTYDTKRMLARMLLGAVLVVVPFLVSIPQVLRVVMLLFGCWLLVSKDFPPSVQADRALEARKNSLPLNICHFFESDVLLEGEGSMHIPYQRFQRLVEDEAYLYLFLGRKSMCMVEKATVSGGQAEELKDFVAKKTGLRWERNRSLLSMNLSELYQAWKVRRT